MGRFLNFFLSLDLHATVLIANLLLTTTNKQRTSTGNSSKKRYRWTVKIGKELCFGDNKRDTDENEKDAFFNLPNLL